MQKSFYYFTLFFLAFGLLLNFLSWTGACTSACEAEHSYLLFGMHFEFVGFIYFSALALSLLGSFSWVTTVLLAGGIGSELLFILVQKFVIGVWCPLCLGIAASIFLATIAWFIHGGKTMFGSKRVYSTSFMLMLGFLTAFIGVAKHEDLHATEKSFQEKLTFGNKNSDTEIYIFTSWICPACHKFEPALEKMAPDLMKNATITFVDYGVDDTTLNYLPFNLSFIINNKDKYIELRKMLKELSTSEKEPTDEEVAAKASSLGIKFHEINYATVASAIEYFKQTAVKFKVRSLPTFVIRDKKSGKTTLISGSQMTPDDVAEATKEIKV